MADGERSNPDWESLGGHYRVRLENNWIDVPDDAVSPTEPGGAHDCMADASWQSNLDPLLHTGKYDLEIISVRPIKMIGLIDRRTVRILVTPWFCIASHGYGAVQVPPSARAAGALEW
jgi:hypothetical protein